MGVNSSRQQYIEQYAGYAMEQMRRYGIPASVTLAQGIIESASGKSTLAQTANNHFGVKGTYNGNYVLANDDRPNEKFKKYDNVGQSYEDHSKVLTANRYQKYTASLSPEDYKGWANAIKKGGYATASNYVSTIVSVIESNDLHKYDQQVMQEMKAQGKKFGVESNPLSSDNSNAKTANTANTVAVKSTGMNLPQGQYSMPVAREESMYITSPYGERVDPINKSQKQVHHGVDIRTRKDDVLATENNGKVIGVDNRTDTGGGKTVTVEYVREDGSKTHVQYMHLSQINVQKGDTVNAGQKLGVSGATGTRVTGEHLHLGVINISADNKKTWVNPTAYLAEINQKGNLNKQALYNGKDLLGQYAAGGQDPKTVLQNQQGEMTPESWMQKLLSSGDAQLDNAQGEGLLGGLFQMLMMLLMLSMKMDKEKSNEEKMQAVSDAIFNKKIDISSFTPNFKNAHISINANGAPVLTVNDGKQEITHELTKNEQNKIAGILNSESDDAMKKQKITNIVYSITFSKQASNTYEQIESQQQTQEQALQRK